MKKMRLILLTALVTGASAFGQGVISLQPIPVTNGVTGTLAGPMVMAQLFDGSPTPLAGPVFLTNGYARFGNVTVPAPGGDFIVLWAVAWDNSSGFYANWAQASAAWQHGLILAGPSDSVFTIVDPVPVAIPGFTIYSVPEPCSAVLGLLLLGLWQARRATHRRLRSVAHSGD
ncbi:MAG TPA: hypothetical protein VMU04_21480 [Candidatus Acidoferrum sp.]|nr:hypothetical protein [Candidatus Acidoferrum sp.]